MAHEFRMGGGAAMTPGIFETVFPRPTLDETFAAVSAAGFVSVQAHLPSAEYDPWTAAAFDRNAARRLGDSASKAGVRIAALDGAYNMAHPDPKVRATGGRGLEQVIQAAQAIDVRYVTLCTGTREPSSMWVFHPDNVSAEAWQDCLDSVSRAVKLAEDLGVTLLVEPEPANIASCAAKARELLDAIGSDALKIVLDPANVVLSDRSRDPGEVLREAFEFLGPSIVLAHAKDLDTAGRFCAAGTGIVPWNEYRSLLEVIGYSGDVIFHTLTESDVPPAREVMGW
jgi:sugar phosphate isomerase/epimerase